jgi:hypothetical protein
MTICKNSGWINSTHFFIIKFNTIDKLTIIYIIEYIGDVANIWHFDNEGQ